MLTASEIKEYALYLGFAKAGICSIESMSEYAAVIANRGAEYDCLKYSRAGNPAEEIHIKRYFPEAKTIICLAMDYFQHDYPKKLTDMVGRMYLGRVYNPTPQMLAYKRLELFYTFLTEHGLTIETKHNLPVRWAAMKAGVASIGRNNFAYVDGHGSFCCLYAIITDADLSCDEPVNCKCPPYCSACMKVCPTQAILSPFRLNPERCIGFLNNVTRDGNGRYSSYIPHDLRKGIGTRIFGCDACQAVCPQNAKKMKEPKPRDAYLDLVAKEWTLSRMMNMDDSFFRCKVMAVTHCGGNEVRYKYRNVAIAIGNTHDPKYLPDLEAAMHNPTCDSMVREYVAWALGEIGGEEAVRILKEARAIESDNALLAEIDLALNAASNAAAVTS